MSLIRREPFGNVEDVFVRDGVRVRATGGP